MFMVLFRSPITVGAIIPQGDFVSFLAPAGRLLISLSFWRTIL
jgi:hypothetical protein